MVRETRSNRLPGPAAGYRTVPISVAAPPSRHHQAHNDIRIASAVYPGNFGSLFRTLIISYIISELFMITVAGLIFSVSRSKLALQLKKTLDQQPKLRKTHEARFFTV